MFKIKGVHHLGLPVNDLERAKKFYTEVLGMGCAWTRCRLTSNINGGSQPPQTLEWHLT